MKRGVFGAKYAMHYDILYQDKPYAEECDRIDGIIKAYAPDSRNILELGCGTGNHSIYLARKGYRLTSIDNSAHMLEIARRKLSPFRVEIAKGDIVLLPHLRRHFDVCLSMFHVFNYILTRTDMKRVLTRIRSLLRRDGLLIFDSWNGIAVLKEGPSIRVKEAVREHTLVRRTVYPTLRANSDICENQFRVRVMEQGKIIDQYNETHKIRYFFPQQIRDLLEECKFEVLDITSEKGSSLADNDWSMLVVAKRN